MTIFKKIKKQDIAYSNVYRTRTESFYLITDIRFYKKKKNYVEIINYCLIEIYVFLLIVHQKNIKKHVALNVFIYIFTILMVLY